MPARRDKDASTPPPLPPRSGRDGGGGGGGSRKGSVSTEGEDSVTETLAERRALHNSVERTRREALNSKFTHLAQQLPSLSHIHRPSKSVIISHCLDMVIDLKETKAENEALKQELFHMRMSLQGVTQPPMRSQLRLSVPQDVLASGRYADGILESSASPRQLSRRHERSPLIPASPRNFRTPYPTALPASYHRPPLRSHQRHSLVSNNGNGNNNGGASSSSMHQDKINPSAFWQPHEMQQRLRLQPESYPVPDYAMVNEHFNKLQSESNHSSGISDSPDEGSYSVPSTAFFPTEYSHHSSGTSNYEGGIILGSSSSGGGGSGGGGGQSAAQAQQQAQYLVKSEEAGLV